MPSPFSATSLRGRPPAGVTFRDRLLSGIVIDLDAAATYDGSPCWPWGRRKRGGYGLIKRETKNIGAHVASFEEFRGPIPAGLEPDHLCHDPEACKLGDKCPHRACCNPWHMEPVSHHANVGRGGSPPARNAGKLCCPGCGTSYQILQDGRRECRRCSTWGKIREVQAADRKAKRAEETEAQRRKRKSNSKYYAKNREKLQGAQKVRDANQAEEHRQYNRDYYRRSYKRLQEGGGGANGDLFNCARAQAE